MSSLRGGGVQSTGGKGGCGCTCIYRLGGGRSRAFLIEEFTLVGWNIKGRCSEV